MSKRPPLSKIQREEEKKDTSFEPDHSTKKGKKKKNVVSSREENVSGPTIEKILQRQQQEAKAVESS